MNILKIVKNLRKLKIIMESILDPEQRFEIEKEHENLIDLDQLYEREISN